MSRSDRHLPPLVMSLQTLPNNVCVRCARAVAADAGTGGRSTQVSEMPKGSRRGAGLGDGRASGESEVGSCGRGLAGLVWGRGLRPRLRKAGAGAEHRVRAGVAWWPGGGYLQGGC